MTACGRAHDDDESVGGDVINTDDERLRLESHSHDTMIVRTQESFASDRNFG